jgi:hypothetical protein
MTGMSGTSVGASGETADDIRGALGVLCINEEIYQRKNAFVMAGFIPAIHIFLAVDEAVRRRWPGQSPAITTVKYY